MNRGFVVSFLLIILGGIFKLSHLLLDTELFQFELWLIGLLCIALGNMGIGFYIMISLIKDYFQKSSEYHGLQEENS